ncbi:hypothetical protein DL93DRAFT_2091756 [Clavulina sp. PMI_390]|nr:hypothetical protein DL93DRAFT_2091756 [Clavulina sp. PMI_390]
MNHLPPGRRMGVKYSSSVIESMLLGSLGGAVANIDRKSSEYSVIIARRGRDGSRKASARRAGPVEKSFS